MTQTRKHVTITADGCCLSNGGENNRAAAAAILCYQNIKRAVACFIGPATNQRAEIIAAALALESLREPCTVTLRSDSKYVVETMNGNFRRKTNLDCWARLDNAAAPHEVNYEWVKGHNGDPEQETADRIARATATLGQVNYEVLTETVDRLNKKPTNTLKENVLLGLRLIAGECDGARRHDGRGFSRFDADFGHSLASKADLTAREVAAGRNLLLRYRTQLSSINPILAASI
jgi:ribonuclease HI